MDEQLARVRHNYDAKTSDIEKYIFLVGLQDRNETLFYRLVVNHLTEMMPILYTPTVGDACRRFGHIFRRPRGLYLSIEDRGRIPGMLRNWPDRDVAVIVVTDGERILGLGDLGAHGMGIPIGKLSLYTACGGVEPARCLPVLLDAGTDNATLRSDPLYTGLRQPRERGTAYDALVEEFIDGVREVFPRALLQWEDFATGNALRLLARYQGRICSFNDDIQGTAAVVLAALLAACRARGERLRDQRLLFMGAGASASGVAGLIVSAIVRDGESEAAARRRVWLFDRDGLVVAGRDREVDHRTPYAHPHPRTGDFGVAIEALRPTGIIGLSTQGKAFNEAIVRAMGRYNERPVIFALSNPTSSAECSAEEAYRWTDGRALFASGSPFAPVTINGRTLLPGQANNACIFPGLGLGLILAGSTRVTDDMFHQAARVVADAVSESDLASGTLLPPLAQIRELSAGIAAAISGREPAAVKRLMFEPQYRPYLAG